MKKHKFNIFIVTILCMVLVSCKVDDYDVANDARQLDAPAGYLNADDLISGDAVTETDTNDDYWTYLPLGGNVTFTIDIVDAPGLIDSVSVRLTNSLRPAPFGTYTINIEGSKGKEAGLVSVTYTAGTDGGEENIEITVWDNQDPRKSEVYSFPKIKIADTDCFPTRKKIIGFYDVLASGYDSVNDSDYVDLSSEVEIYYRGDNHPGWVRFSDGSFGLYAEQGEDPNFINVELCDNKVVSANEEFTNFAGTINVDGTINISWENTFGDTGNVVMTPQVAN